MPSYQVYLIRSDQVQSQPIALIPSGQLARDTIHTSAGVWVLSRALDSDVGPNPESRLQFLSYAQPTRRSAHKVNALSGFRLVDIGDGWIAQCTVEIDAPPPTTPANEPYRPPVGTIKLLIASPEHEPYELVIGGRKPSADNPPSRYGYADCRVDSTGDPGRLWIWPGLWAPPYMIDARAALEKRQDYVPPTESSKYPAIGRADGSGGAWLIVSPVDRALHFAAPAPADPSQRAAALLPGQPVHDVIPLGKGDALALVDRPGRLGVVYVSSTGAIKDIILAPRPEMTDGVLERLHLAHRFSVYRSKSGKRALIDVRSTDDPFRYDSNLLWLDADAGTLTTICRYDCQAASAGPGGTRVWLSLSDYSSQIGRGVFLVDLDADTPLVAGAGLFRGQPVPPYVPPATFADAYVINTVEMAYFVRPAAGAFALSLVTGPKILAPRTGAPATTDHLKLDPNAPAVDFKVRLGGQPDASLSAGARVSLHIACPGHDGTVELETSEIPTFKGDFALHRKSQTGKPIPYGESCSLRVAFVDAMGSRVEYRWTNVEFVEPKDFFLQPWFLSIVAYGVMMLCLLASFSVKSRYRRWTPAGVALMPAVTIMLALPQVFDRLVFGGLLAGTFVVAAVAGLVSPVAFRALERSEPFRTLAPIAFSFPRMKRRLLQRYLRRVREYVAYARQLAGDEKYCDIGIEIMASQIPGGDDRLKELKPLDAAKLCGLLQKDGVNMLVEAPGGRGKSALVRAVIEGALDAAEDDIGQPIPVVCEGEGADLLARIAAALGPDCPSEELLNALLQAGQFFIVIDGVTESSVTTAMLNTHLTRYGAACPILLSGRPNPSFERFLRNTDSWLLLSPSALTDITLGEFVRSYGHPPEAFTDVLRNACRNLDNTYLPVVVRLALLASDGQPASVAEIYERAILRLVGGDAALFDAAIDLCFGTYWVNGERILAYLQLDSTQRDTADKLLKASVMVPVQSRVGANRFQAPTRLRFFHDSLQSYLTALAVRRQANNTDLVLEAAAHPRFKNDRGRRAAHDMPEVFEMCLHTFLGEQRGRETLYKELVVWSQRYAGTFSRDWVVEECGKLSISLPIGPDVAGGIALRTAIERCHTEGDIRLIGGIYAAVANVLWPRLRPQA